MIYLCVNGGVRTSPWGCNINLKVERRLTGHERKLFRDTKWCPFLSSLLFTCEILDSPIPRPASKNVQSDRQKSLTVHTEFARGRVIHNSHSDTHIHSQKCADPPNHVGSIRAEEMAAFNYVRGNERQRVRETKEQRGKDNKRGTEKQNGDLKLSLHVKECVLVCL